MKHIDPFSFDEKSYRKILTDEYTSFFRGDSRYIRVKFDKNDITYIRSIFNRNNIIEYDYSIMIQAGQRKIDISKFADEWYTVYLNNSISIKLYVCDQFYGLKELMDSI